MPTKSFHIPSLLPLFLQGILAATPLTLHAQLHESVNVEGTYLKDILHPDRINQLPKITRYSMATEELPYASSGVAADFDPLSPVIAATTDAADRSLSLRRGYIDLSAGSWLNANLSAGVGIIMHPDRRLDLRLQHNSTSLWHPFGDAAPARVSYQENIGLSYAGKFRDAGLLSVAGQYHVGYFNYYGLDPEIARNFSTSGEILKFPTQTLQDAALRIGWESDVSGSPLKWNAGAGMRYFGYRTATRETEAGVDGGVALRMGEYGRGGIDASLKMLFYSEHKGGLKAPDSYAALTLTPYYRWRRNAISLNAGFDLDLTFNADSYETGKHYALLHAAPDVRFDIATRNVGFYIHLTGGSELHTLAAMSQLDPYRNPHLASTRPMHTPIDAAIGVTTNPFAGFSASLDLRYKSTSGVPLEGWYMAQLNYGTRPIPGLILPSGILNPYGQELHRYTLSGVATTLRLDYRPSRVFHIGAKGSYSPQNDDTGFFNGLDRPRWILEAEMEISPVRQLALGVRYGYRGVRRIYTGYLASPSLLPAPAGSTAEAAEEFRLASLRLPDITNLSAYAVWNVTPALSLNVQADNLLNHRMTLLPMLPSEGMAISGGLRLLF